MKKIVVAIIVLLIYIPIYSQDALAGVINDNDVRLRDKPSLDSSIIKKLSNNTIINIIKYDKSFYYDNGKIFVWINVKHNDITGWVSSKYISTDTKILFNQMDIMLGSLYRPNQSDRDVLCITKKAKLYDDQMVNVAVLKKGSKAKIVTGEYSTIPEKYLSYTKNNMILLNGELIPISIIQHQDKYFLIDTRDLSWMIYSNKDSLYYVKTSYYYKEVNYLDKQKTLAFAPKMEIVKENNNVELAIIKLKTEIEDTYLSYESIRGFIVYNSIIVINLESFGGRFLGGGGYNELLVVFDKQNNEYKKMSENVINHGES
jgi:hypothetical protein